MAVIMVSLAGSFNTTRETVLMRKKRNQGVVSGAISPSAAFLLQLHNPCLSGPSFLKPPPVEQKSTNRDDGKDEKHNHHPSCVPPILEFIFTT